MEPTQALQTLEVGLRRLILDRLGVGWLDAEGAPSRERLQGRLDSETKKRHGAVVSRNLLDYTMTPDLGRMLFANWDSFAPVLGSKERLEALLGIVEDVRNTVAHSRELLPFERELLSGVAGYVSNSLALHRGSSDGPEAFYPLIESISDHLGNDLSKVTYGEIAGPRLSVGDDVTIRATSTPMRGVELVWRLAVGQGSHFASSYYQPAVEVMGSEVELTHCITEDDVGEGFWMEVLLTTESRFHRYMESGLRSYDDLVAFRYPIAPPYGL